jgi:hypothetical protein
MRRVSSSCPPMAISSACWTAPSLHRCDVTQFCQFRVSLRYERYTYLSSTSLHVVCGHASQESLLPLQPLALKCSAFVVTAARPVSVAVLGQSSQHTLTSAVLCALHALSQQPILLATTMLKALMMQTEFACTGACRLTSQCCFSLHCHTLASLYGVPYA